MRLNMEYEDVQRGGIFKRTYKGVRFSLECSAEEVARINHLQLGGQTLLEWELYDAPPQGSDIYFNRAAIKSGLLANPLSPVYKTTISVSDLLKGGFLFARDNTAQLKPYEDRLLSNVKALSEELKTSETGTARSVDF